MIVADISKYAGSIRDLRRRGRLEAALHSLINFALSLTERESTFGRVFGSPELDHACSQLGTLTAGSQLFAVRPRSGVVVIATAIYGRGGHTGSLSDLLRIDNPGQATVLLTNVGHDLELRELAEILPEGVKVEIAPSTGLATRMRWVQDRLKALRPERSYLFQHPYDAVAVAAAQPSLVGDLYFYHHADHGFTFGLHAPGAVHIDPTPKIFHHCRAEHQSNNVYWPLTTPDISGPKKQRRSLPLHRLVTCCSGGMDKFESVASVDRVPYRVSYPAAVSTVLRTTGGRHVHVGPLSDVMLDEIATAMDANGISTSKFVHIPETSDLAKTLRSESVDLYMGSLPRGGGRALVAAMSLGLPMLLHANYRGRFMSDVGEAYPGVLQWTSLADLQQVLASVSPSLLKEHGLLSRGKYEASHTAQHFAEAVRATLAGEAPPVPPRPTSVSDPLQAYLDEQGRRESPELPDDLLAMLLERNEGWKKLGGPRIDQALTETALYSGTLPESGGVYVHAGRNGETSAAAIVPENGRAVVGLRARAELSDRRSATVEFALVGVPGDDPPDLQKVAAVLSSVRSQRKSADLLLLAPWQEIAADKPIPIRLEWRQRKPLRSVILAVRMGALNPKNDYAMLSLRDLEWKAAPSRGRREG